MWRLRIFCYHGFPATQADAFRSQLISFRDRGLKFASLSEALSKKPPGDHATVSFDDGERVVFDVAKKVLDDLGIKAILYLSTDFAVTGRLYHESNGPLAMSWEQLREWLAAGHELGSHTHSHARMSAITNDKQRDELQKSRELMQENLGLDPIHFAYPWGGHNRRTLETIRSMNHWKSVATIDRGWNTIATDPLKLHREAIDPDWPMSKIHFRLAAASFGPLYKLQRAMRIRKNAADFE